MKITSKRQFYDLWQAGVLGNRPRTWECIEEAITFGATRIGFREIGKAGGGKFELAESQPDALRIAKEWDREGRRYNLDGGVPNDRVQLQGEVCRTIRGLEGFLAIRSGTHIRAALAAGLFKSYGSILTHAFLAHYMDASSRDDVDALLELFPDAAIEFACFPINVGVIPGRNTIIWEVRDY